MACGSVYSKEAQKIGRDLSSLELETHRPTQQRHQEQSRHQVYSIRNGSGHEAIKFLQAEHEKVLDGLHLQIQALQQKCDDLQFEAHLRHVTEKDDNSLKSQIEVLTADLEGKDRTIQELRQELENDKKHQEELIEQNQWKELQLKQQIEVGEQKIVELKEECSSLRAKVKDLKVYSAALRRGDQSPRPSSRTSAFEENEHFSMESEEPLSGTWRETRLGTLQHRRRRTSGVSVDKAPSGLDLPLNTSIDLSASISSVASGMETSRSCVSRPESVMLPPINLSQSVGRPQFRQLLRFSSAPPAENTSHRAKRRASNSVMARRSKPPE